MGMTRVFLLTSYDDDDALFSAFMAARRGICSSRSRAPTSSAPSGRSRPAAVFAAKIDAAAHV
jgi:hypothetical protein